MKTETESERMLAWIDSGQYENPGPYPKSGIASKFRADLERVYLTDGWTRDLRDQLYRMAIDRANGAGLREIVIQYDELLELARAIVTASRGAWALRIPGDEV